MKLDQHQLHPSTVAGTADPAPPAAAPAPGVDAMTLMLLAFFAAIVVTAFWKVLLKVAIVGVVTLVFAGVFVVPLMLMQL